MPYLFLLFIIVPLVEIYFLIRVGEVIGGLETIGLVILTAFIGAFLLRIQGFYTLNRVREQLARGQIPALELLEGLLLLMAGFLLLTPGFFTDAIGFMCLVPVLRRSFIAFLIGWFSRHRRGPGNRPGPGPGPGSGPADSAGKPGHRPRVIEGEYQREDD